MPQLVAMEQGLDLQAVADTGNKREMLELQEMAAKRWVMALAFAGLNNSLCMPLKESTANNWLKGNDIIPKDLADLINHTTN